MKKIVIIFSIFVLVSALVSSCTKSSAIISNNTAITTKSIYAKDGRLVFKDSVTFIAHLKWIQENQATPEVIEAFNKNLGIKSLNTIYQEGLKLEDEQQFANFRGKHPDVFNVHTEDSAEFVDLPCPNVISFIANESGVYQVGNLVTKTLVNNLVMQKYKDEAQVAHLSAISGNTSELKSVAPNNGNTSGVSVYQVYYKTAYRTNYPHPGRLVAKCNHYSYSSGLILYDAISVSQRHFRFVGWVRNNLAGRVGVSYTSKKTMNDIYGNRTTYNDAGGDSDPGSRQSFTVFSYYIYQNVNLGLSSCKVTHTGTDQTIIIDNLF